MNSFTYLGKNSLDFGLRIEEGVSFESPEQDIEYVEVKGLDGDVPVDNERLKSTLKSFPVTMFPNDNQTISEQATDISNWLKSSKGYSTLEVGNEPLYSYLASYNEQYSISQFLRHYGKAALNFRIMPYKFLKTSLSEITLGSTITNPTQRHARPLITVRGTGNITIKIGQSTWTLRNVDQGVVIDTLLDTVTNLSGTAAAWDKITSYPLPTIAPGNNAVTITGNVTDIKIIPRWEVIVG
jgi:phage-related protein